MLGVPGRMKVIDISSRIRETKDESVEGVEGAVAQVIELGRCVACLTPRRLSCGACDKCRKRFGDKCGLLFQRVRESPEFAARFYEALTAGRQRAFVSLFGLPPGCREPGETPCPGPHPHLRAVSSTTTRNPRGSGS